MFANAARMIFFDKLMEETEEIGRNAHKRAGECHTEEAALCVARTPEGQAAAGRAAAAEGQGVG